MDAPALSPAPLSQAGEGRKPAASSTASNFPIPACVLPLPLAGEGWGEGGSINEVKVIAIATAGPHPRPSPASGRGEQTSGGPPAIARASAATHSVPVHKT
ncbi:protein of unknown function (plasmid) [Cupriavidus neocaledonicus]|uniref:Uncharacterized protein n=1 Tax=Cupriavidus neocaledonicus TaxID=1040979 RepID=A0A375HUM4_9BURK|nr:hypothetical protein CBM2605_B80046 [Cupriavidus neocaledonicus]SPD60420.1 protein of unknown function [Cupriavidus neocaledonicus]